MSPSPRYLVIPDIGKDEISQLLDLSAEQLRIIAYTLRSTDTLKAKEASYRRVASRADITNQQALSILNATANLIVQRKRYGLKPEQLLGELEALLPEKIKSLEDETQIALLDLLSESDEGYIVDKAETLKHGFSPHVVSMRSICDARPVFDKDKKTIRGMLIVASLGITTHDEGHRDHTVVIQMSMEELEDLQKLLEETKGKMQIIHNDLEGKFEILS